MLCVLMCPWVPYFPPTLRALRGGAVGGGDNHSARDNTHAKGYHTSLLSSNHPLEPTGPCRPFTCLGADMGLGRREGGLGFDWQLSSLLWACPSLPPSIPAGYRSQWGESSSQGNVCSCLEQTRAGDPASLWLPGRLGPLEFMFIFTAWVPRR